MRLKIKIWQTILLSAILNFTLAPSALADSEQALSLDQVLSSSIRHTPRILEAIERQRGAIAKQLAATGNFDSSFQQNSLFWLSGFYNGSYIDNSFVKPLENSGGKIYGGYRSGTGTFPVYEDELITLNRGEFNVGVLFPLLRNRNFDEKRYQLRNSELNIELTQADILLTKVQVQHNAMIAYWRWLAVGRRLAVYDHLLKIAEQRDLAFSELFTAGNIAEIDLVENTQNVLKRRARVARAQGEFEVAALTLSLYYRDENGDPKSPQQAQLPAVFPTINLSTLQHVDKDIEKALLRQAELNRIDVEMEQAKLQLKLGENLLKPQVDLGVKAARDIGDGRSSSVGNDLIVELEVSVPIGRRTARGEIGASKARLSELFFERQQVQEQLKTNIKQLTFSLNAAAEFADLAQQEATQAARLESAERKRQIEGASTFFLLNLREENTADAKVRGILSRLSYFEALTNYYAATVNTDAFRISNP